MRPRVTIRNAVGLLALAASLALASPGVNVVRAEPERPGDHAATARAGECPAPNAEAAAQPGVARFVTDVRREHASPSKKLPKRPDGESVVLNTQGYNYGPPRGHANEPPPSDVPRR